MNTNLVHNVLNVVMILISLVVAIMVWTGCTTLANGELECSQSVINPAAASLIVTILGAIKILINVTRDGLAGLAKKQPPVK